MRPPIACTAAALLAGATLATATTPALAARVQPAPPAPCRAIERRPDPSPASHGIGTPVASGYLPGYGHPEVDLRRTVLDLDWDGRVLRGTAVLHLATTRALTALPLDLAAPMTVRAASIDGRRVPVRRTATGLVLATGPLAAGSEHDVRIDYSGRPRPLHVAVGRQDEGMGWITRPDGEVTTYAEPIGASTWFPTNELPSDKSIYTATVRTKAPMTAVFNGVQCSTATRGGIMTSTWHAAAPMPAYLVSLSLGRYSRHPVALSHGRTAWLYLRPQDLPDRERLTRDIRYAVDRLESRLGPYPFASLGVVLTAGDTAMETQTMVSLSAGSYTSSRTTIVHELAHQWFGDEVTTATWTDLWLNEGFAMFLEMQEPGVPWYDDSAANAAMCGLASVEDGQAGHVRTGHLTGDGPYLCGAMALAELRDRTGAQRFWSALKDWPASRRYGIATRADFVAYWHAATGTDPSGILARWLDHANPDMTTRTKVKG